MTKKDHDRYLAACTYPGTIDEAAVEAHLAQYLAALGYTVDRTKKEYPHLTDEQISAALSYARSHPEVQTSESTTAAFTRRLEP